MMFSTHQLLACAAWLAFCALPAPACAADAGNPSAYALRLPLTVADGAPLQRLALPAEALVALQAPSYADVRVFNASGQAVPMALSPVPPAEAGRQQTVLPAYPLLGNATSASALDGLALRIEERSRNGLRERVVTVNTAASGGVAASAAPASPATRSASPTGPQTLGALLDARGVQRPAVALMLEADLPVGQPITFTVASSADLATWRPLAETVLYRAEATTTAPATGTASLGTSILTFAATRLAGQYLRVSWADASGQLAGAALRSATLVTAADAPAVVRPSATVAAPVLNSPHAVSFSLPFATPVAALQVRPEGSNVVIPLRVLGRQGANQPWQPLASTVVYSLQSASKLQTSGPVALPGSSARDIKLEADEKTPGFAAPPEVTVLFEPVQLVFVASGPAPFTLAAGLDQAASAWLPLGSIVPALNTDTDELARQVAALPLAVVSGGDASVALITALPVSSSPPARSLVLWGVLVAGALALALMAWALLKPARGSLAADASGNAG